MAETKLSLTVELPGNKMVSEQECSKQLIVGKKDDEGNLIKDKNGKPVMVSKESFDPALNNLNVIKTFNGKTKKYEFLKFYTRKQRNIQQVINMTDSAYNYFISDEIPQGFKGNWKTQSKKAKLAWHMQNTARALGGKVVSYKVIGD